MNTATALKVAGLGLRLIVFLIILVVLVYIATAVCFQCKVTDLARGLVTLSSICAIVVSWLLIVMKPRS